MAPEIFPAYRIVFYLSSLELPPEAIQKLVEMKLGFTCNVKDELKLFEGMVKQGFLEQKDLNLLQYSAPLLAAGIKSDKTFDRAFTVTSEEINALRPTFDLPPQHPLIRSNALSILVLAQLKKTQNADIKARELQGAEAKKALGRMVPPEDEVPTDFRFPGMG